MRRWLEVYNHGKAGIHVTHADHLRIQTWPRLRQGSWEEQSEPSVMCIRARFIASTHGKVACESLDKLHLATPTLPAGRPIQQAESMGLRMIAPSRLMKMGAWRNRDAGRCVLEDLLSLSPRRCSRRKMKHDGKRACWRAFARRPDFEQSHARLVAAGECDCRQRRSRTAFRLCGAGAA